MRSAEKRFKIIEFVISKSKINMDTVGHTYLQKLIYLLQEALYVNLGYKFKLYHYGPYCPELLGDLELLSESGSITVFQNPKGFGYDFDVGEDFQEPELGGEEEKISQLIELLSNKNVKFLEAFATAHFSYKNLLRSGEDVSKRKLASIVKKLKPHLSNDEISNSIEQLNKENLVSL